MNDTERLGQWLRDSDNIVFFGGAGVSTESNIPDFRSADGLYRAEKNYGYPQVSQHKNNKPILRIETKAPTNFS